MGSPHEASQADHGGGRGADNHASSLNQSGRDGTGLRDGSAAINNRSVKTHAAERVESTPLKIELISESHEKYKLLVIEVIILRTIQGHIR